MSSLFMLDTKGDQQLLGEAKSSVPLYSNVFHEKDLLSEAETNHNVGQNADDGALEFFWVKLSSKDISQAVASVQTAASKKTSKVALELAAVSEQLNVALQTDNTYTRNTPQNRRRGAAGAVDTSGFNEETGKMEEELDLRESLVKQHMQNTRHVPGFEQIKALPRVPIRKQRILNRAERAKTKGSGWFDLPATEVNQEMRNELKIIQMRSVLDPKHFYKKNDLKVLPKYFQIGTVQHSPLDHYSERNTRKSKKTLVDELLEDEAFQKFNKRKYNEVLQRTNKYAHRKAMKKMKKLKKHK